MPRIAAYTGFTQYGNSTNNSTQYNISGNFLKGWNFYTKAWKSGETIFFEVLGFRDTNSKRPTGYGYVAYVNEEGRYFSSGTYSTVYGYYFSIANYAINTQDWGSRSFGLTIRPAIE